MPQIDTAVKGPSPRQDHRRIKQWQDSKLGRMSLSCTVLRNGKPLADADVKFVPEKFLARISRRFGQDRQERVAMISVPTTGRDDPPGWPRLYRVEITRPATPSREVQHRDDFGQEVALDAKGIQEGSSSS